MRISPKEWQKFLPAPLSLTLPFSLSLAHTMAGLLISVAQKMAAASANFADNENRVVLLYLLPSTTFLPPRSPFAKLRKNFHQRLQFSLTEVFVYCQPGGMGRGERGDLEKRVDSLPMAPDYLNSLEFLGAHWHTAVFDWDFLCFNIKIKSSIYNTCIYRTRMMLLTQLWY